MTTHIEKQTSCIRSHLSSILGETTAKTYFSYYGIFKDGLMLGLYKEHKFYLKVPQKHLEAIQLHNLERLIDPKISGAKMYYLIPTNIMNNLTHYHQWFTDSLEEAKQLKQQIYTTKQQFIRSLPNMNLSLERTLKKVNIHTIDDLIERGEVNIFVDLIKLGIDVDSTFLFKLYGAVHRKLIYALSPEQKTPYSKKLILHSIIRVCVNDSPSTKPTIFYDPYHKIHKKYHSLERQSFLSYPLNVTIFLVYFYIEY